MKTRQQYMPEFKRRALGLARESNKPLAQIAKELDIKVNTLYNWHQLVLKKADAAFTNRPTLNEQELEIKRLRSKIVELEEEKIILKKAAAYFAKESL